MSIGSPGQDRKTGWQARAPAPCFPTCWSSARVWIILKFGRMLVALGRNAWYLCERNDHRNSLTGVPRRRAARAPMAAPVPRRLLRHGGLTAAVPGGLGRTPGRRRRMSELGVPAVGAGSLRRYSAWISPPPRCPEGEGARAGTRFSARRAPPGGAAARRGRRGRADAPTFPRTSTRGLSRRSAGRGQPGRAVLRRVPEGGAGGGWRQ